MFARGSGVRRCSRIAGTGAAVIAWAVMLSGTAVAAPTVVTFSFVDNLISHYETALPLLNKHGFKASFGVNSCRLQGAPAGPLDCPRGVTPSAEYMSWAQLNEIYAQGNEVVGHTRYHQIDQTIDDRAEDICADRRNLAAQGFAVTSFAYPGGSQYVDQAVVAGCGYNSGRVGQGLRSAHASIWPACPACPPAGLLRPENPFAVPATNALNRSVAAGTLAQQVTDAAAAGGGWINYIVESVCPSGCDVSSTMLDEFLFWLRTAAPAGTEVRTADQVIGGTLQPPPPGATVGVSAPAPRPGTPIQISTRDRVAPRIVFLNLTRRNFAPRRRGRGAGRRGTVIRYTLSEKATVKVQVERQKGRRYIKLRGALTRRSTRLVNRLAFSGRIGSRLLAPGRYRFVVSATDAAGNRARPRRVAFRVLRR